MPTFKRCPIDVDAAASTLMFKYPCFAPLIDAEIKIDFVFAYPDLDETTGEPKGDALKKNGVKALGITRKLPLKDRAMGRADAEIALDGAWWEKAPGAEQRALLDHELFHLVPTGKRDDLGRPLLKLRPHDYEFGWFEAVANRHGNASQERQQAQRLIDQSGQFFWPDLALMPQQRAKKAASRITHLELQLTKPE